VNVLDELMEYSQQFTSNIIAKSFYKRTRDITPKKSAGAVRKIPMMDHEKLYLQKKFLTKKKSLSKPDPERHFL
jgi:hypothetical protein